MPRKLSRRHRHMETAELNITAFMNLMVVLVPFLLITAVFSQVSILKMNLPNASDSPDKDKPKKPPLVLELIYTPNQLIINDRNSGPLTFIKKKGEVYDFKKVNNFLKTVKAKFPKITSITLLSQEETTYDDLIQGMDAVRFTQEASSESGEPTLYELFPNISIGSAPVETVSNKGA